MTETVAGSYLVRRRADGSYVRIVEMRAEHAARAEATAFGYDDACDFVGFHSGDPRGYALVRLDGPLQRLGAALRRLLPF